MNWPESKPPYDYLNPYGVWEMPELTNEEEIQRMIKMGKERGPSYQHKMKYDGELIDAWVIFHETFKSDVMTEAMRHPLAFEREAKKTLEEKHEFLPYLTLVESKLNKEYNPNDNMEYFHIKLYYCHGEILLLRDNKPHLFV